MPKTYIQPEKKEASKKKRQFQAQPFILSFKKKKIHNNKTKLEAHDSNNSETALAMKKNLFLCLCIFIKTQNTS